MFIFIVLYMVLGVGWVKFVCDNKFEKGDVVVFEFKNLNIFIFMVYIFCVKDYIFVRVVNFGRIKYFDSSMVFIFFKIDNFFGNV